MNSTLKYYERQKEFHVFVTDTYAQLAHLREAGDKGSFNATLLRILPEVKRYISKNLQAALNKGRVPKNKYDTDGFINELFIEAYEHFDEVAHEKELHPWLFKKADELLDDVLTEEEFDDFFFKNIDNYSKPEWDAMEQKFSTDGDGDLVMLEELEDISYNRHDYILKDIFIEDDREAMVEKLDEKLDEEKKRHHIHMVLQQMPDPMRRIFELFNDHQFKLAEIAQIRDTTVAEVEKFLADARKILKTSLFNRYLTE